MDNANVISKGVVVEISQALKTRRLLAEIDEKLLWKSVKTKLCIKYTAKAWILMYFNNELCHFPSGKRRRGGNMAAGIMLRLLYHIKRKGVV